MADTTFKGRVVVITGASAGIGRELARQLAGQKAKLAISARNEDALNEVASMCREAGGEAIVIPADVSDKDQCRNLIEQTVETYGTVDALINNAGITMWARLDEIEEPSIIETIMSVNYFGSAYCTYYALPYLKESRGRIVGISSLTGKVGVPTRSCYAASKHAMAGFFDSLRVELTDSGVSVTMIYPGFVATEVRERALGPDGKPMGTSPIQEASVMSVEACCNQIISAMSSRKREVVMTLKGKVGQWLKLFAPGIVDRLAKNAIASGK